MYKKYSIIKRIPIYLIAIISIFYVASFFFIPFSDWDTVFYPLVGKGIFQYGILPYGYIFEHKPFLVYIFYYYWCRICPIFYGRFAVLSILSIIVISFIVKVFYKVYIRNSLFFLFFGSVLGEYLSGNTEVIQIPIILLSIIIISISIENNNIFLAFLSGLVASIAINVNYMSGIIIFLIICFLLLSNSFKFNYFLSIIIGVLIGSILILMPFIFHGHGSLEKYFSMQYRFLHYYSKYKQERLIGMLTNLGKLIFLLPILWIWFGNKKIFWNNIYSRVITIWFLCSVFVSIVSGHNYSHYSILFLIPAMIICSILYKSGKLTSFLSIYPILIYSSFSMLYTTFDNFKYMNKINTINPNLVSDIVGGKKVLNIRSDQSLYYLSNMEPFDPFLFQYHIDIYFNENANEHYMQDLKNNPSFVLMQYRACEGKRTEKNICEWINYHYHLVYKAYDNKKPLKITRRYYELYEINDK